MENNDCKMEIFKTEAPPDEMQAATTQTHTMPLSERRTSLADAADNQPKKKKTRRGKCKRKPHYQKYGKKQIKLVKQQSIVKPEAPRNNNQFLLEDHGGLEELDENIKYSMDLASTSSIARTRDSSFSVDSEADEFYSSPDDEDEFLMKEFDDDYHSIKVEQLHVMTKEELIDEFLCLENRCTQKCRDLEETIRCLEKEVAKWKADKENLERDILILKTKLEKKTCGENSDSEDSETDSSDSCCSSSSSESRSSNAGSCKSNSTPATESVQVNGHEPPSNGVDPI